MINFQINEVSFVGAVEEVDRGSFLKMFEKWLNNWPEVEVKKLKNLLWKYDKYFP